MIGRQNSFTLMTSGQIARRAGIRASAVTSSPASYFTFGRLFASNPKSSGDNKQSRTQHNPEEGRDRELGGDNETMHQRNLEQERPDFGVKNQPDSDLAKTIEKGRHAKSEPTIDVTSVQADQVENIQKGPSPSSNPRGEGTTHVVFRREENAPSAFTRDPQTADFADENSSKGDAKMWQAANQESSGLPNMEQGTGSIGEQEAEEFKEQAQKTSDRGYGHVPKGGKA